MNCLKRNKKQIYLCNKSSSNDRIIFSNPILKEINFQPISSTGEIIALGENYTKRLKIVTTKKIADSFHNLDRCYVFNSIPETPDIYCSNADFYVDGEPQIYINDAIIYLQRMIGDDLDENL